MIIPIRCFSCGKVRGGKELKKRRGRRRKQRKRKRKKTKDYNQDYDGNRC